MKVIHLPILFQSVQKPDPIPNFSTLITNPYLKEYADILSPVVNIQFPTNNSNFVESLLRDHNPTLQAAIYAGIAQSLLGKGQLIDAAKIFGYAFSLIPKAKPNFRAFIQYKMAGLLMINYNYNDALFLVQSGLEHGKTDFLLHLGNFYKNTIKHLIHRPVSIEEIHTSASFFKKKKYHSIVIEHFSLEGDLNKKEGKLKEAKKFYDIGTTEAQKNNYTHLAESLSIKAALLEMELGDPGKSVEKMKQLNILEKNYYHRVLVQSSLGATIRGLGNTTEATFFLQQGLNLATQYGVNHLIPHCSFHLGECYEEQGKLKLAHYFFERGYQTAITLIKQNLNCSNPFLKSIERYIKFLQENPLSTQLQPTESDFSFAKDKSLIEIRSIFQNALLGIFYAKYGTFKDMARKLQISERTISLVKHRIKYQNFKEVPDSIAQFIQNNQDKNWKEINQVFEAKVLKYLFKAHYPNKKRMSEKLNISYPHMLNLLKQADSYEKPDNE